MVLTIGLEESLPKLPGAVIPSKLWSPYRLPLIRFLNQYPTERQVTGACVFACGWQPCFLLSAACVEQANIVSFATLISRFFWLQRIILYRRSKSACQ